VQQRTMQAGQQSEKAYIESIGERANQEWGKGSTAGKGQEKPRRSNLVGGIDRHVQKGQVRRRGG